MLWGWWSVCHRRKQTDFFSFFHLFINFFLLYLAIDHIPHSDWQIPWRHVFFISAQQLCKFSTVFWDFQKVWVSEILIGRGAVRSCWRFGLKQYAGRGTGEPEFQETLRDWWGVGWCVSVCGIRLHSLSLTREPQLWDQDRLLQVWARLWGSSLCHVGGSRVWDQGKGRLLHVCLCVWETVSVCVNAGRRIWLKIEESKICCV